MTVATTVLFGRPNTAISSLMQSRLSGATSVSVVTGFATPGGLAEIGGPILSNPHCLDTVVLGAATYPAFGMLDSLLDAGVPADRLFINLGKSRTTGWPAKPYPSYRPMLHSKVYYMERAGGDASAFIGSHNLTAFALGGLNGEASVLLEGQRDADVFVKVREHIREAKLASVQYDRNLKDAYAAWSQEYFLGWKIEIDAPPPEWKPERTILIFCAGSKAHLPKIGEAVYFEMPSGVRQIDSLNTVVHLFIFDTLPHSPQEALSNRMSAHTFRTCKVRGSDKKHGYREVATQWRISSRTAPNLVSVSGGSYRPGKTRGEQQICAEVSELTIQSSDYKFEKPGSGWNPELADDELSSRESSLSTELARREAQGRNLPPGSWQRVVGLVERREIDPDEAALAEVAPESRRSFILVARGRRDSSSSRSSE